MQHKSLNPPVLGYQGFNLPDLSFFLYPLTVNPLSDSDVSREDTVALYAEF